MNILLSSTPSVYLSTSTHFGTFEKTMAVRFNTVYKFLKLLVQWKWNFRQPANINKALLLVLHIYIRISIPSQVYIVIIFTSCSLGKGIMYMQSIFTDKVKWDAGRTWQHPGGNDQMSVIHISSAMAWVEANVTKWKQKSCIFFTLTKTTTCFNLWLP